MALKQRPGKEFATSAVTALPPPMVERPTPVGISIFQRFLNLFQSQC